MVGTDELTGGRAKGSNENRESPKISVIIPTRDNPSDLERCVKSVVGQETEFEVEIIVVNNRSKSPAAHRMFENLRASGIRVLDFDKRFNFSEICNFAIESSGREILCMINDDVALTGVNCLQSLGTRAIDDQSGVIGGILYYPGTKKIQHAGITLRPFRIAKNASRVSSKARGLPAYEVSAVTFALACFTYSKYKIIGPLDEKLAVGWNDVDYGVRASKLGLKNEILTEVTGIHVESATRGTIWTMTNGARAVKESFRYLLKHGLLRERHLAKPTGKELED